MSGDRRASPWLFLERDMFKSPAWLGLGGLAPHVYMLFRLRLQVHRVKGPQHKRTPFEFVNNGELRFGYAEAKHDFGISIPRFRRALAELVARGFLDVAHHGGGLEGDVSKYAISERWRRYGQPDFEAVTLPRGRGWTKKATHENVSAPTYENVSGA
jgi:hypothetical protein